MNTLRTTFLLAGLTALLLVMGHAMGGHNGMILAFFLAAAMNFGAYWFSDRMVLSMYNAQPVGPQEAPELYDMVAELARRAQLPMPRVYIIDDPTPNAFATGRNPEHAAVAATTGILRILNRQELMGVMAHEMGHVLNRDILVATIAATIAGAVTSLANMAQWAMLFGSNNNDEEEGGGAVGIVMMILAPIAAALIQMAVSRAREYGADDAGARLAGDPLWLASALAKLEQGNRVIPMQAAADHPATAHMFIVNPLTATSLANLFSTHPPIEERIRRLQYMAHGR